MAWMHESAGRGDRVVLYVVALIFVAGGVLGLFAGKDVSAQIFAPVVCFALAGLMATLARGEKGHSLSVDEQRLAWTWHLPGRGRVSADLAVAELRELHREWEPPAVVAGRTERRRVQQVFVVTADGGRRRLPPHVLRDWAKLVAELRAVRPDLKVVERETADFSPAEA